MAPLSTGSSRFIILAAIDESPRASLVIANAASFARARSDRSPEIHLLHVADRALEADATGLSFDMDKHKSYLDARAREARDLSGVAVIGHLLENNPADAIVQTAASIDADLVIVGTRDRTGPARWLLGSVAQKVMQHAACPVLVVRTKAHASAQVPEIEPPESFAVGSNIIRP